MIRYFNGLSFWLILDEYVTNLLNNGSKVPVDIDGSYEMQLPEWADESKIKKLVQLFMKIFHVTKPIFVLEIHEFINKSCLLLCIYNIDVWNRFFETSVI